MLELQKRLVLQLSVGIGTAGVGTAVPLMISKDGTVGRVATFGWGEA
jgi:hypothetical protein